MIEFNSALDIPEDFTGICKILNYESISYFKNGVLHREDGPAIILKHEKHWYINGKRHREDGPASEYGNGDKHWYQHGKLHREDGPAVEYSNGHKKWYQNGKHHRLDGPAIEYTSGHKEWWFENELIGEYMFNNYKHTYSQEEFNRFVKLALFK